MKFEINDAIFLKKRLYLPKSYNIMNYSPYMGNKCLFVFILTYKEESKNDHV